MDDRRGLPKRVRVLILGGGIHGVGVLHDLASRGFKDVFLLEKSSLAHGTSSKSTKLIHGGLRYLKRISDFNLVIEALRERSLLLNLVPDLVHPIEMFFPILNHGGESGWKIKLGLSLYDNLAFTHNIKRHKFVAKDKVLEKVPIVNLDNFKKVYSYWDAQTDDLALVTRVANSAVELGGYLAEGYKAEKIHPTDEGWDVEVLDHMGKKSVISALYVVNCLGPWANDFLQSNGIDPKFNGIKNKGSHLILPDYGLKAGLFLQSPEDERIFFLLPWKGYTLLGTTEDEFTGNPDEVKADDKDVEYLLSHCNRYLSRQIKENEIIAKFAGLRWLALEKNKNISSISREFSIGEHVSGRGLMMTLYGGKLTSYRSLSERIGDRISNHFGEFRPSETHLQKSWIKGANTISNPVERFSI